jgi:hypothetical protein
MLPFYENLTSPPFKHSVLCAMYIYFISLSNVHCRSLYSMMGRGGSAGIARQCLGRPAGDGLGSLPPSPPSPPQGSLTAPPRDEVLGTNRRANKPPQPVRLVPETGMKSSTSPAIPARLTKHCGKKHRKFPSQITDAADHNRPVTENSGIKFPTS